MKKDFMITSIERVIMVDSKIEYPEKTTSFASGISPTNELVLHFSGKSKVYYNNNVFDIQENCIRFLPKTKYKTYMVDREEHGLCIVIYFLTDKPVNEDAFVLPIANNKMIPSLFKKIFSLWISKQEGYYFDCVSILYKIFAEMQKTNYLPEKKYLQIKPVIDYIQANFTGNQISADELVNVSNISYSYIRKLFIQKFGMPPKAYSHYLKMNYAGELLYSGLYNTSQVSEMCGYDNINLFFRQFKKYYDMTPNQYKQKYISSK